MDSTLASQSPDSSDAKPSFRKPASDAVNRRYRRHSPASGSASPSSSGSPTRGHRQSPIYSRDVKDADDRRKRKDDGIFDKGYGHNHSSKLSSSYRSSGRNSYESSHVDRRYDVYGRSHRRADEDRDYGRSSSRYGKDSKGSSRGDYARYDGDHDRSKDDRYWADRFSRDKNADDGALSSRNSDREHRRDEDYSRSKQRSMLDKDRSGDRDRHRDRNGREEDRTDNRRSSRDDRNDHSSSHEIHREHKRSSNALRDGNEDHLKEAGYGSRMELDGQKEERVSRRKMDDVKEHFSREEHLQDASKTSRYRDREEKTGKSHEKDIDTDVHNSFDKKVKLSQSEKAIGDAANDLESSRSSTHGTEEKSSSSSKQLENPPSKGILEPPSSSASIAEATNDLNAAKVAAMKAAELVNKNLVGVGYLSTEQKKKLLWGNKKNATVEESGNRWDMALFSDKERQEKFNKLMGVKGDPKLDHAGEDKDGADSALRAEKQKELQLDLEKQYTAGLRRRDGRTVGLGL
ncbi:uncharacterized protein LOC116256831 isoform X2 [Nymphaea colorata]|nr:uncharacterized protein LOC116256831 isoform X2 [Nymphaea colorata]